MHPEDARIRGIHHVMWCDKPRNARAHARNAVFYGDKAIDRSPCGTGSSARVAQLAAKGKLKTGENFVHESIIGTMFDCRVESEDPRRQLQGDPPEHRRLGAGHRPQHDFCR